MVTKAGARREERDRRERIKSGSSTCGAIVIGMLLFVFPRTTTWISADLICAFALSVYPVWHLWGHPARWFVRVACIVLSLGIFVVIGFYTWPRITVLPLEMNFNGKQESFSFTVTNATEANRYWVNIPVLVAKGLAGKLKSQDVNSDEEGGRLRIAYSYCYGTDSKERMLFYLPHMKPGEKDVFTINYSGGEPFTAHVQPTASSDEPAGYSETETSIAYRMDLNLGVCAQMARVAK